MSTPGTRLRRRFGTERAIDWLSSVNGGDPRSVGPTEISHWVVLFWRTRKPRRARLPRLVALLGLRPAVLTSSGFVERVAPFSPSHRWQLVHRLAGRMKGATGSGKTADASTTGANGVSDEARSEALDRSQSGLSECLTLLSTHSHSSRTNP
ncbi:hypothetical protein [Halohasta litorea]|uniref:Transposase n=1 Tax=Halohasta litorea TaxID=869891 RepID=A0ABD6D506_9EURY|nr:hypothetical protein [Halohasta litorea]